MSDEQGTFNATCVPKQGELLSGTSRWALLWPSAGQCVNCEPAETQAVTWLHRKNNISTGNRRSCVTRLEWVPFQMSPSLGRKSGFIICKHVAWSKAPGHDSNLECVSVAIAAVGAIRLSHFSALLKSSCFLFNFMWERTKLLAFAHSKESNERDVYSNLRLLYSLLSDSQCFWRALNYFQRKTLAFWNTGVLVQGCIFSDSFALFLPLSLFPKDFDFAEMPLGG